MRGVGSITTMVQKSFLHPRITHESFQNARVTPSISSYLQFHLHRKSTVGQTELKEVALSVQHQLTRLTIYLCGLNPRLDKDQ